MPAFFCSRIPFDYCHSRMNSKFKRLIFRAILVLLSPVVFLGLAEIGLRAAGFGYPNDLLVPISVQQRPMWTGNLFYTYRFFPPPLARVPSPILIAQDKPPGEVRIVILGESAAQGDPVPAFGVSRMLEILLRRRFSDDGIQVVNAAVTAISTAVIRDISSELGKLNPDVVILYMGNNEVIGPYGPASPISRLTRLPLLQRMAVASTRLRLVQAIQLAVSLAAERRGPVVFQGVAKTLDRPVSHADPRLKSMRRHYKHNVREIMARAREAGAQVLVSTVAVNHTDCPPAISLHRPGLSEADRQTWEAHYAKGLRSFEAGRWQAALEHFELAAGIDSHPADLAYRRAECLEKLGQGEKAQDAYALALDLDAFRYRTDSTLNNILRELAAMEPNGVALVDADGHFRNSGESMDEEWFVDHVHFSFEGTWKLATTLGDALLAMAPLKFRPPTQDAWMPVEEVRVRMGFDPVAESRFHAALLGRYRQPPFNRQHNIARREASALRRLEELSRIMFSRDPGDISQDQGSHVHNDTVLASLQASSLIFYKQYADALTVLSPLVELYPHRRDLRALMAEVQLGLGNPRQAAHELLGFSSRHGFLAMQTAEPHLDRLMESGQMDAAYEYAQTLASRLHRLDYPWRARQYRAALHDLRSGRDRAADELRRGDRDAAAKIWADLMERHPTSPLPPYGLAVHEGCQGDLGKARALLQLAVSRWDYPRACFYAGLWESHFGDSEQARRLFGNALRFTGEDKELLNDFAWLRAHFPHVPAPAASHAQTDPAPRQTRGISSTPIRTPRPHDLLQSLQKNLGRQMGVGALFAAGGAGPA
jgi:tetratricopeptide (TPR) repeat protein